MENGRMDTGVETGLPKDTIVTAQIFSPPYLFTRGDRPKILSLPTTIRYSERFYAGADVAGRYC
jgi:hypothetical protein